MRFNIISIVIVSLLNAEIAFSLFLLCVYLDIFIETITMIITTKTTYLTTSKRRFFILNDAKYEKEGKKRRRKKFSVVQTNKQTNFI